MEYQEKQPHVSFTMFLMMPLNSSIYINVSSLEHFMYEKVFPKPVNTHMEEGSHLALKIFFCLQFVQVIWSYSQHFTHAHFPSMSADY